MKPRAGLGLIGSLGLFALSGFAQGAPAGVAPAAGLGDYLHRAEVLLAQLERHGAYLHLRASRDMDDRADADGDDRIADAVDLLTGRAEAALRTLGGAAFAKAAAANPSLRRWSNRFTMA
jgi:oligoendopeptidase F